MGYVPNEKIPEAIKASSLCSDLMVRDLGLCKDVCSSEFNTSIFLPFPNKAMRNAFESANGRDFPVIYLDTLKELQAAVRFPLPISLVEVMRSEWCKLQYEAQNYDSYLSYYINSDGHSRDGTASVYPYSGLRARSAYLRALEFTAVNFKMPKSVHELKANLAFPFDQSLFFLQPDNILNIDKYKWSSEPSKTLDSIQSLIFDTTSEHKELGAVSFSVHLDDLSFIEVEVVRASCAFDGKSSDNKEPWLWRVQEKSNSSEKIIVNASEEDDSFPLLVAKSYPYQHFGHWHSELESRGIYCPVLWNESDKVVMRYADKCIEFICDKYKIAEFKYTNNNWQPSYNRSGKPNTISMLMLEKEHRKVWSNPTQNESFYCKVRIFKKNESYSDYEMEEYEQLLLSKLN